MAQGNVALKSVSMRNTRIDSLLGVINQANREYHLSHSLQELDCSGCNQVTPEVCDFSCDQTCMKCGGVANCYCDEMQDDKGHVDRPS